MPPSLPQHETLADVRFGSKGGHLAAVQTSCPLYPNSRHQADMAQCPLSANSGHRPNYPITSSAEERAIHGSPCTNMSGRYGSALTPPP